MSDHPPGTRRATVSDLAELVRLASLAREHVAALKGGHTFLARDARPAPPDPSLQADLDHPDRIVLVGALGEVVVGYAVGRLVPVVGGRLAVVTDLFVEVDGRGVGVGAAMMTHLVRWADESRCDGIDAVALPGDRETKNFFEGFGLVARSITVHRSLGESDFVGDAGAESNAGSDPDD